MGTTMAKEGGHLASMDSVESRWVLEDDGDGVSGDDDLPPRMALDYSEDNDGREQRLIQTTPHVGSFDVEALEVPGTERLDYEVLEDAHEQINTAISMALKESKPL